MVDIDYNEQFEFEAETDSSDTQSDALELGEIQKIQREIKQNSSV